jgi:UDP-N-acetylmuramoylalanine--D-glutamate ligase
MLDKLYDFFANKKVLLLGYGLEGQSSARLLQKLNCAESVTVKEQHRHTDELPSEYDVIIKSPGIPLFEHMNNKDPRITGQADLFLRFCENPVIGITGTKGKSTTSSLVRHILSGCGMKSRLIGNIGVPAFDVAGELTPDEIVVFELSCHQLEYTRASPKIAVFLNLFEDHLDHYRDFAHYRAAKENIFRFQRDGDLLIRGNAEPALVCPPASKVVFPDKSRIDADKARLRGAHNLHNMAVAVKAAQCLCSQLRLRRGGNLPTEEQLIQAAYSFGGLEHRLELFAEADGVKWVNDSISTIPEAVIAAVEAFPETDTLIIGGMDRGIDYSALIAFLRTWNGNIIALPDSGHKITDGLPAYRAGDMTDAVEHARKVTRQCCVLSPAAASYGFYKNFEERGRHFKELVLTKSC